MANIQDVAQKAGVSVATVSRVFNNQTTVAKKTRMRVEQAINDPIVQCSEFDEDATISYVTINNELAA